MTKPNTTNSELRAGLKALAEDYGVLSEQGGASLSFYFDDLEALIASKVEEAERNIELYYLEKLCKVYDDINTGVAKKQSNSTYYINKAIHTEEEIKSIKTLQPRDQDKV